MDFEIEKKEFFRGLNLVQSVSGRKTTLPILSHVLMEWQNESLYLTGTDLETAIREELTAKVHQEGKASVSAKKLYEIVRELPEKTIQIQKKENQWVRLQCGKSTFNLAGLDPEEFPSLPVSSKDAFAEVPKTVLVEMIEKTVFAASNEESRYHLNGVFLVQKKVGGKELLRMVATDGHRLSLIEREGPGIRGIEKGVILPKKGVQEIKKIVGDREVEDRMEVYFDSTHAFLKIGRSLIIIRLIDGEFPEYDQVIPKENDKKLVMVKELAHSTLRRVSTMVSERVEGIKLALKKDGMEISSYNQDFGDAKEELDVVYDGPSFEIGFNARYLMEALNVIDQQDVIMEVKDEGSPGLLRPSAPQEGSNQICIIMPMRI
jgi:DNA polymerase III subunit beta